MQYLFSYNRSYTRFIKRETIPRTEVLNLYNNVVDIENYVVSTISLKMKVHVIYSI